MPSGSFWQAQLIRSVTSMTAFLKIDHCRRCSRQIPWEWIPAILLHGKALAGTGVWRSQLIDDTCPTCLKTEQEHRHKEQRALGMRGRLIQLLGGEMPYREFTFERFEIAPGNRLAYERCKHFNPSIESLYLWGACGVGKTHLAWAAGRRCFEETLGLTILPAYQLARKVRMKEPAQEQATIDEFADAEVLIIDDLGSGSDTAFTRQVLQEILDRRKFRDLGGLLITSKYSLDEFAAKLADDSIPSRLSGMCEVIEVKGSDHRLTTRVVRR